MSLRNLFASMIISLLIVSPSAARSSLERAREMLHGHSPFVLVAVPREFLSAPGAKGDDIETRADWAYYLNMWTTAHNKMPVVVVSNGEFRALIASPGHGDTCVTLFARGKHAAYYDDDCVSAPYDDGVAWMRSRKLIAKAPLRVESLRLKSY